MPGTRIVLAAALAGSVLCPPLAGALDAHVVLTHCAATADPNLRGLAAIRKVCPGVGHAVAALGMGAMLPARWEKGASPAALAGLDALATRYAGRPPSKLPAASDLRAIALRLQPPGPHSAPSWWNHLEAWLRDRLAPLQGLLKWFRSLPGGSPGAGTRRVLLVAASALILLSLVAIIIRELRAAGVFGQDRRRRSRARRRVANTGVTATRGGIGDDAQGALDRPASALRLLIEALRRSRRIERDGNLTCREILTRAVFDTHGQRQGFASIALLAERELFGPLETPVRIPDELRAGLQALYDQLLAAPARSATS